MNPKKPTTRNMSHPDYYQQRLKEKISANRTKYKQRIEEIERIYREERKWKDNAKLVEYNTIFRPLINESIETLALSIHRRNGETLRIFEDGVGKGIALMELVSNIRSKGIICEASGTTLEYNKTFQSSNIKIIGKSTEEYMPTKKQHLIIANMGGLSYTLQTLKKDTFLKLCYSLEKGGVMLAAVSWYIPDGVAIDIRKDLGLDLKGERLFDSTATTLFGEAGNLSALQKALEKRGFESKVMFDPKYMYGILVYVKRLR